MNKPIRLLFCLLVILQLFPASPIFAETVQDVPVGETTISSKAEDPLKEYKEKAQNQVPTVESVVSQDVPGVEKEAETSPTKIKDDIGESPTPENGGAEEQEATNQRIEPRGGVVPLSGTILREGNFGDDPASYDIDRKLSEVIRTVKRTTNRNNSWSGFGKPAGTLTKGDLENLNILEVGDRYLSSIKGVEFAVNLTILVCSRNQLTELDVSKNKALTSLDCYYNQISSLDVRSNVSLTNLECHSNLLGTIDVSKNTNLKILNCSFNQLNEVDISNNLALVRFVCNNNQLSELDVSNHTELYDLNCNTNPLGELDVSKNIKLVYLNCSSTSLDELDVSKNTLLYDLNCSYSQLSELDVSKNTLLYRLNCSGSQLSELDVSKNLALEELGCSLLEDLSELDVSKNKLLRSLSCGGTKISELDLNANSALLSLNCSKSSQLKTLLVNGATALYSLTLTESLLEELDLTNNNALTTLQCYSNSKLSELDLSNNTQLSTVECYSNKLSKLILTGATRLTRLNCSFNELTELNVEDNTSLDTLNCSNNRLKTLGVGNNTSLVSLSCAFNYISDITFANNLTNLTYFAAGSQSMSMPVPPVSSNGEAEVAILKTTAQVGLSARNGNISPLPVFSCNGDKILMSNVTRESLSDKYIQFSYDGNQLAEGALSGTKHFSGYIHFYTVSDLGSELKPNKKKVSSGDEVEWTWTISCLTQKKADNIRATLSALPSGLVLNPVTFVIDKNGSITTTNDLNNTSLGDLNSGETIKITFKTIANGDAEEWLETAARLDWEDDTASSPHSSEVEGSVKILDEEQQDLPKDSDDMGILSAPVRFHFGKQTLLSSIATHQLNAQNYQTNTNVVTDGFYTRIKDDQVTSTGWKLSASLSEFTDSVGRQMPNGAGTSLRLENMFIQKVNDRDTPQEALDPVAVGGPSTVRTDETLVAGQTAKTLVSAQVNEGQGTWQLQMPFDDISLTLPAGAGKSNTDYTAKLTWSLDDTP